MRSAPPVLVPVGRFVWGGRCAGLLALLSVLVWALTALMQTMSAARMALLGLVCLLSTGLSGWAWRREQLPPGELSWDGEDWWYISQHGNSRRVSVALSWDAGRAMLLNVRNPASGGYWAQYLWLQAREVPHQWHALRCAVYGGDTL